ncbi:hypothetical protein OUY22_34620 [Nonomuraea sp. MCN248]|uniref:Uncharacterized protein n=1 Tax=Nonomuraea corallina TaxID=2989783 RepID=A0ABT4SNQ6_9ACTN|nr:hypothetical protein [Nonomuraea corallina]MDA0638570.1 hypothetical protein [Nonomuraea corallina]
MESEDGRVILFVVIAITLFIAGRRYQTLVTTRKAWRDATRSVITRKQVAADATRSMLWVAVITGFILWLVANLNRMM